MRWIVVPILLAVLLLGQQNRDLRLEPDQPSNSLGDRGVRWALVVGISNHQHLPPQAQLKFAHRDAEEFAAFLRSPSGGSLPASRVRLLTNEQATLAAIRAALQHWLVPSAGPDDVVYVFFAGHGVTAERDESFFVAHDSDPQNLHATALPFAELEEALSGQLRAGLAVVAVDACHSGSLGWSTYSPDPPGRTATSLEQMGRKDRSFLKLLASRPSERSYEDARWNGGHGIFTHSLLQGLRGQADRDADGVVRAGELIDYLGRVVPEETESRQHPRIAGTFDARVPMASALASPTVAAASNLDIAGAAGSAVYIDGVFRGVVRQDGTLRIEGMPLGSHRLSVDFGDASTVEGRFTLTASSSRMTLPRAAPNPVAELRARLAAGQVLEAGGAWDYYRQQASAGAHRVPATALMAEALEELGNACVSDYVQSTQIGPKRTMLRRATDALERLRVLRPGDKTVETRRLFCGARLAIAENQFEGAVKLLQQVVDRDADFACAHNALGVALERLNRPAESRRAFEAAAGLTPEWALPLFHLASQHAGRGDYRQAEPLLAKAVRLHPRSAVNRWNLLRVHRLMGRVKDVEAGAAELLRQHPNYAPTYLELARSREADGALTEAAEAYEAYLQLAPNYADSDAIRSQAQQIRQRLARPVPSLRKR